MPDAHHTKTRVGASEDDMANADYTLVIGTKSWSSWSLRPWLLMRQFGLPFQEIVIPLRTPQSAAAIQRYSPSGKIPALVAGNVTVWDSLSITEYLADAHAELAIWPREAHARAIARSISAEMHGGFQALRQNCPMDINATGLAPADPSAISADVARIVAIWHDCRARFGGTGPFLFGAFSAADAMYAPVVSRFHSYGIDLKGASDTDGVAARYGEAIWQLPALDEWRAAARAEPATDTLGPSL